MDCKSLTRRFAPPSPGGRGTCWTRPKTKAPAEAGAFLSYTRPSDLLHVDLAAAKREQVVTKRLDLLIHVAPKDLRDLRLPLPGHVVLCEERRHSCIRSDNPGVQQPGPYPFRPQARVHILQIWSDF